MTDPRNEPRTADAVLIDDRNRRGYGCPKCHELDAPCGQHPNFVPVEAVTTEAGRMMVAALRRLPADQRSGSPILEPSFAVSLIEQEARRQALEEAAERAPLTLISTLPAWGVPEHVIELVQKRVRSAILSETEG